MGEKTDLSKKIWYSMQIKKICENKHISFAELSVMSGLNEEYLYKILNAEISPSANSLRSIALALDVSPETMSNPIK
jgi:transcriptional regulator with XRE-family HTH domain